jgi:hypothetical protein
LRPGKEGPAHRHSPARPDCPARRLASHCPAPCLSPAMKSRRRLVTVQCQALIPKESGQKRIGALNPASLIWQGKPTAYWRIDQRRCLSRPMRKSVASTSAHSPASGFVPVPGECARPGSARHWSMPPHVAGQADMPRQRVGVTVQARPEPSAGRTQGSVLAHKTSAVPDVRQGGAKVRW